MHECVASSVLNILQVSSILSCARATKYNRLLYRIPLTLSSTILHMRRADERDDASPGTQRIKRHRGDALENLEIHHDYQIGSFDGGCTAKTEPFVTASVVLRTCAFDSILFFCVRVAFDLGDRQKTVEARQNEASFISSVVHIVSQIIQRLIVLRIGARHAFLSDPHFCWRAPENVNMSRAKSTIVAKLRTTEAGVSRCPDADLRVSKSRLCISTFSGLRQQK
eukprot:4473073-Pleurochrysis_carterae.AAC.1